MIYDEAPRSSRGEHVLCADTPSPPGTSAPYPCDGQKQGTIRSTATDALLATSASLDLVELLVVAHVGRDYRDLANAGKAQVDAARTTTRPA